MKKNNLSILPITRGNYIISCFEAYQKLPRPNSKVIQIAFPEHIHSIDYENITSEATAINCAYVSGIFSDFTREEELVPTVTGRMSSGDFKFKIEDRQQKIRHNIDVNNSQVEIDGGFEGIGSLTIIEAKNSISDDFLIRQLYYPYRLWNNKIGESKNVIPVFMIYSNGIFSLYEYMFEKPKNYNSLVLINQKNYSIEPEEIELDDVIDILKNTRIDREPEGIPFPQADNFNRVINLCEVLYENDILTRDDITYNYDFDSRQTNYYTDACKYLGLVDKKRENGIVKYSLTEKGKSAFSNSIRKRILMFVKWILEKKAFYLNFKKYLDCFEIPTKLEIMDIMKQSDLYKVEAESTYKRRASTISGWINWIMDLTR